MPVLDKDSCCGLKMPCENLSFCLQHEPLHDPTVMAWIRMNPPPSIPLHSVARAEFTSQLSAQESYLDILHTKLDDARREVETAYKVVVETLIQIKEARLLVTKSRAILAPIRCLPTEILSCILAFVDPPEIPDQIDDITSLCCVSKRWNQAVKITPELWTNWQLSFGCSYHSQGIWSNMKPPARMEEFLLKSMPRQLDFKIDSIDPYGPVFSAPRPILDCIFRSVPRCSRLVYQCGIWRGICFCPKILADLHRVSSVRHLGLIIPHPKHWEKIKQHVPEKIDLSGLQSLAVGGCIDTLPRLHLPHLSDLLLQQLSLEFQDLLNLAASLPNLLVLRCASVFSYKSGEEHPSPIRFQRLREFHLMERGSWKSDPRLCGTIMHDSTTLLIVRRNIIQVSDLGGTQDLQPARNISYLELVLDAFFLEFDWEGASTEAADWFAMTPNLSTMVLKWKSHRDYSHSHRDHKDYNNLLAANILHSMWISQSHGPCRRLKYLKCCRAACGEVSTAWSTTRVFLINLENFVYPRSAERVERNGTEPCVVSVNWRHTAESSHLPDLVDAGWEELQGLLDLMPGEEALSDDDMTEASDCTWSGEDLDPDDSDWIEEEEDEDEEPVWDADVTKTSEFTRSGEDFDPDEAAEEEEEEEEEPLSGNDVTKAPESTQSGEDLDLDCSDGRQGEEETTNDELDIEEQAEISKF